jgi:hypothetical protein
MGGGAGDMVCLRQFPLLATASYLPSEDIVGNLIITTVNSEPPFPSMGKDWDAKTTL